MIHLFRAVRFVAIQKEAEPRGGAYVTSPLCYTSASLFRIFGCLFFGNVCLRIRESDSDARGVCQCALAPILAGMMKKCSMACHTQQDLSQHVNGAGKSQRKTLLSRADVFKNIF